MAYLSFREVLKQNAQHKALINAVLNQLNIDTDETPEETHIYDINNHGIGGGFGGFIYYSDTVAFYRKYRTAINEWLLQFAEELGEDPITMVCNFGCIKDNSPETKKEIGKCLYGGKLPESSTIPNALAWFAAEEVCRLFDN